ncbi:MAG: nucleotide disphospho-sugar-binding domain-containing protein [Cyanobacteria bacterium J06598_1]
MAHIVCVTGGLTGIFNASLALIEQLLKAGHHVTYASPADFSEALSAERIPFVQLAPWVIQSGDPPMGRWEKLRKLRSRQDRAIAAFGTEHFADTITGLLPDLVLIDIEMHPHIMAAVTAELPVALLCPFISIWKRPHLPPISTGIVPGEGWRGSRVGIELSWFQHGWNGWMSAQRERWRRMGLDRLSVLRRYAQKLGHPFNRAYGFSQWLVPYPHEDLPILCLNAQELAFESKPHPLMHYVGPSVAAQRKDLRVTAETKASLEQLFAKISSRHHSSERPLIYCGCSSFMRGSEQFLQQVVAAVAQRPDWTLVIGLGGRQDPSELSPLPENVQAFNWTPQLQVLSHADCAIINSGAHSIAECIHFGVPMLAYSLENACQNGNAARVKYHGLGIVGDLAQDSAAQIQGYLQQLLERDDYRQRVKEFSDRTRIYGQENRAAKIVENIISQVPPAGVSK